MNQVSFTTSKIKYALITTIILTVLGVILFISNNFYKKQNDLIFESKDVNRTRVETIISMHEKSANIIYNTLITNDILKILSEVNDQNKNQKREELKNKIMPFYKKIKAQNIRQFHFHLKNNESFLRLHKPEKFGDDLTDIRESIRLANSNQINIKGFEEGRIYNGYRFVFPLLYNQVHVGSVETSFSIKSILDVLKQIDPNSQFHFILRKDIVQKKLFENELENYIDYPLSSKFVEDKEIHKSFLIPQKIQTSLLEHRQFISEKIEAVLNFQDAKVEPIIILKDNILSQYHPIYNISNQLVGMIVFHKKSAIFNELKITFYQVIFIILILTFILVWTINLLFRFIQRDISHQKTRVLKATTVSLHHEIRNPLAIISSTCSYLYKKTKLEEYEHLYDSIQKNVKRITNILDKLNEVHEVEFTKYSDGSDMLDINHSEDQ